MIFWVLSVDFKKASLEERAQSILSESVFATALDTTTERMGLVTCNRVLWLGVSEQDPESYRQVWASKANISVEQIDLYSQQAALAYLFRVVSSLESMVVGETQITGQFKRAYEDAIQKGWIGKNIHRFAQQALRVSKKVRQETEIGQLAVSVPSVGVKLAEKVLGDLSTKTIGILGAGETGRLAAEHFATTEPRELIIFNRTRDKAEQVVRSFQREKIKAVVANDLSEAVAQVDILVACTKGLKLSQAEVLAMRKTEKPLFVLDLSSPAAIEAFSGSENLYFGIDELQRIAEENAGVRAHEMSRALRMVQAEVLSGWKEWHRPELDEAFSVLAQKIEGLRQKEMTSLRQRVQVSEADWAQVEKMTKRLVDKIIQDPMAEVKSRAAEEESWLHFFRKLFRI